MTFTKDQIKEIGWLNSLNYDTWAKFGLNLQESPSPEIYPNKESRNYKIADANRKAAIRAHNLVCRYLEKYGLSINNDIPNQRYYYFLKLAEKEFLDGIRVDFELMKLMEE